MSEGERLVRIGQSARGRPIEASVLAPDGARGTILVIAGLHAMEAAGTAVAEALVAAVREAPVGSPWRRRRWAVVPVANPDGRAEVDAALAAGGRAARRFRRGNARGVDLNRNFGVHWDGDYYLSRWFPRVFAAGDGPLSEPETAALDALAAAERPAAVVSLHAFGEWIYVPWAGRREPPPAQPAMLEIARAMAAAQRRPYKVAALAQRSRLFRAHGAEIDHFHERFGAYAFLVEIGAGPRLDDPRGWLVPYRWYTPRDEALAADVANVLPALAALAEAALPGD
jgi:predicted deacylase